MGAVEGMSDPSDAIARVETLINRMLKAGNNKLLH